MRRAVLLGVVAGLPLVFSWRLTLDPFNTFKLALVFIGVSAAGAIKLAEIAAGARATGLKLLLLPAGMLGGPLLLAWATSDYRGWALIGQHFRYEGLLPYLLLIILGVLLADGFAGRPRPLAWALAASGTVVGAYAFVQALGLDPLEIPIRQYVTSTVGHSNFFGGFLAVALPAALGLWLSGGRRARWALAMTIPIVTGLLMSGSQGAWGAALAGTIVTVGLFAGRSRRTRVLAAAGAAVVTVVVVGAVVVTLIDPFGSHVNETARARGFWWRAAVSMAGDSPIVGHGPNTFAIEGSHYRPDVDAIAHRSGWADSPHSVPLSMLASAGILGLLGFVGVAAWTTRKAASIPPGHGVAAGFAGGATAYFVQSLVSIDELLIGAMLWITLAGLVISTRQRAAAVIATRSPGALVLAGLGVIGFVWATSWAIDFVLAERHAVLGMRAFADADYAHGRAEFEAAISHRDDYFFHSSMGRGLGTAAIVLGGADGAPYFAAMKETFSYIETFPKVDDIVLYAQLLHDRSVYDAGLRVEAKLLFERALYFDSGNPLTRAEWAHVMIRLGRAEQAVGPTEAFIAMLKKDYPQYAPSWPELWAMLAIAKAESGDVTGAQSALDEGAALSEDFEQTCHFRVASGVIAAARSPNPEDVQPPHGLVFCRPALAALVPGYDPTRFSY